jgi:hypothetical protein
VVEPATGQPDLFEYSDAWAVIAQGTATDSEADNIMKHFVYIFFILVLVLYWSSDFLLSAIGKALIIHTSPVPSKAAVMLNTDQEYYSRLT